MSLLSITLVIAQVLSFILIIVLAKIVAMNEERLNLLHKFAESQVKVNEEICKIITKE